MDLPARYRAGDLALEGRAGDLSLDGMFFLSLYLDEPRGQEVEVEIDLPDDEGSLSLTAEVRWADASSLRSGMGVRFVNVPLPDRVALANLVLRLAARSS